MAKKASQKKPTSPAPNPQRDMFVIMPFSGTKSCTEEQWTDIFENVFSPAAEAAGLACSRARVSTGSLIKSIVERLRTSYIVLADITDANPNVFYELGVRHSLSKRTIIVAQGANHIPSDLRGYWSLVYGTGPGQVKKFGEDLKSIVDQINSEPERPDSPVGDYLEREFVQSSRQANYDVARRLSALHTELTGIEVELTRGSSNPAANSLTHHNCLTAFLEERYVDPGADLLSFAYETRDLLRHMIADGLPHTSGSLARKAVSKLKDSVADIRKRISNGTFTHDEQLSVVEWSLPEGQSIGSPSTFYLPCSSSSKGNFAEQRKMFELFWQVTNALRNRSIGQHSGALCFNDSKLHLSDLKKAEEDETQKEEAGN